MKLLSNPFPPDERSQKSAATQPVGAADPKISRRGALKKFAAYTAPAVIALLTTRDAIASTG